MNDSQTLLLLKEAQKAIDATTADLNRARDRLLAIEAIVKDLQKSAVSRALENQKN